MEHIPNEPLIVEMVIVEITSKTLQVFFAKPQYMHPLYLYTSDTIEATFMYHFFYIFCNAYKIRVDDRDRTALIPAWKAGAPPIMRHRHGAKDEVRSRNIRLGKPVLYQLSYFCIEQNNGIEPS